MLRRLSTEVPTARSLPSPIRAAGGSGRAWTTWALGAVAAVACGIAGAGLGLALTEAAIRRDFGVGATRIGAWSIAPASGTVDINPYQRAHFAGTGEIPMASGQGVSLMAVRDDAGRKLDRSCTYRIVGPVAKARFWTLTAMDAAGLPLTTGDGRTSFTSAGVLRGGDGNFEIVLSSVVQPGNWLPLAGQGRLSLALRLYDTAVTAMTSRELRDLPVPAIVPVSCP